MKRLLSLAIVSLFSFTNTAAGQTFKKPASVQQVHPDPEEYRHWLPNHPGHGTFHGKNPGVTPWHPHPPHGFPPHFPHPRPPQCAVNRPAPQRSFWMGDFHAVDEGTSPFLPNGTVYSVFRNVKDFGAMGDGRTDDTAAFNRAINAGGRASGGQGIGGTTGQPALIYVPSGTYIISSTIQMFVNTQIIGDAVNFPTLQAASSTENGTIVLGGFDPGTGSTTNFYIAVRNLNIDTTHVPASRTVFALNWAVSQGTSLSSVNFKLAPDSNHIGIEMDGGSGGGGSGLFMGDLTISGGLIGLLFNNQQYAIRNVIFTNVRTAIAIQHAFVITLQQIHCFQVGVCVDMGQEDVAGSMTFLDSTCEDCGVVVNGTSSIVMENVDVRNSGPTLRTNGVTKVEGSLAGKTFAHGHIYRTNDDTLTATNGTFLPYTNRGTLTDRSGMYFTKSQPQYTDFPPSAFASVKDMGAKGDGQTDDTAALQAALIANANCKITYIPHGVYVLTDTLYVPPGSRIIGEVWSTITAAGDKFKDADNPRAMVEVGKPGEVGVAEFSDLIFTVADILPGCIMVEVNMRGANQGDVSFHSIIARIGGAVDSKTETECTTVADPCKAAFMAVWLRQTSSTYIEDAWLWSADHDLDGPNTQQIGTGRGMYVEATAGTWLVGTGSEHHVLYAYQLHDAQNVFAALMQVETPYFQPGPRAPAPWTPDPAFNDPTFEGCVAANVSQCFMSWSLRIIGANTHTLPLYGQGFWVFFNGPTLFGPCTTLPDGLCQQYIVNFGPEVRRGGGVELYNLNTRGVEELVTIGGSGPQEMKIEPRVDNQENLGSWGAVIAGYLGFE